MANLPPDLQADHLAAQPKGLVFQVFRKDGKGQRWMPVSELFNDLLAAFECAQALSAFQIGILLINSNGGSMYWTSRNPEVFNSTVIEQG